MKVNKHLKIDAITNSTGRLPRDMENLEIYHYPSSKKEPINVGEMDLTYLIRAFAKCQRTLMENSPTEQYHDLHGKIAKLEEMLEEKDEIIDKFVKEEHRWRKAYHDNFNLEGHRYIFSDIPNDASGRAFVAQLREYLNTDSYKIRVRGQYLIDGEDWKRYSYGQPIEKSKCLRVYVDKK
tara:strand:- start:2743 stop:3282 length:540 start_codon:yes stop_codon:yes gene_type:complete